MYEIVNVQYTGTYNNGGTSIPAVLGEFRASSAADLPAQNVDCHIICGCDGLDIATGDRYIWNGTAWILQPKDNAFTNVYTKAEIDNMSNVIYQTMLYYHTAHESSDGSITFYTLGTPVSSLTIYGNGQQTGTPTPTAPITPDFVGTLSDADWTIPITCAGQTVTVYLGEVPTVRRVRKLVFDGTENWVYRSGEPQNVYFLEFAGLVVVSNSGLCTHYQNQDSGSFSTLADKHVLNRLSPDSSKAYIAIRDSSFSLLSDFKAFLAAQYAAGTPVTIWYVLATPETAIVNEPLAKIDDYADELHSTDAGVTIPTVSGENTLTVDTDLIPSKIVISGGE